MSFISDHCTPPALGGGEAVKAAAVVAATTTTPPPTTTAVSSGPGEQLELVQQQLLPSIHKIMEEDKLKELNGVKAAVEPLIITSGGGAAEVTALPAAAATASKKLGPLVDYDSDSDEESSASEEDSIAGNSLPPAKRIKPNSAPAV